MAINFTANSHVVNLGTPAALDNLGVGTFMAWVKPRSIANDNTVFMGKSNPTLTVYNVLTLNAGAGDFGHWFEKDSALLNVFTNNELVSTSKWNFLVSSIDAGGADGDQHLYYGDMLDMAAEIDDYNVRTVGSGSHTTDASLDWGFGGVGDAIAGPYSPGPVAWCAVWSVQLTLAQIQWQQFHTYRPVDPGNCIAFMHLGIHGSGGLGTQIDWSGNGNNGTVESSPAKSDHPGIPIVQTMLPAWIEQSVAAAGNPWNYYAQQ